MNIRIAGIEDDSIVNGPGLRLCVFTQGCPHDCEGCHNPETHDPAGGKDKDTADIISMLEDNPLLDGITFSGGDPFCQSAACAEIARKAHGMGLNVWAYSGWTYEALCAKAAGDEAVKAFLSECDVLVDGPFILAKRTLDCKWRGSSNQRLIDVPGSLASGETKVIG